MKGIGLMAGISALLATMRFNDINLYRSPHFQQSNGYLGIRHRSQAKLRKIMRQRRR